MLRYMYTAIFCIIVTSMLLPHATGRPVDPKSGDVLDLVRRRILAPAPASPKPASQEQPDYIVAHSPDWVCGPLDQDVKGTDIEVIMDITKEECKTKCVQELSCTYITYASKWPQPTDGAIAVDCMGPLSGSPNCDSQPSEGGDRTRCVLKEDWNDGPDGITGKSLAVSWCCDKNVTDCSL